MPRFLVPHDPNWKNAFEAEATSITSSLGEGTISIHHIGSTAIAGILAKPIIDLLGIVCDFAFLDARSGVLEALGYEVMGHYGIEGRRYYRKTDIAGQRTHHLHVFVKGSAHIVRHLAFRDYLRCHADVASEYSNLKASMTIGPEPSWEDYADGKAPFIAAVEKDALIWFQKNGLAKKSTTDST